MGQKTEKPWLTLTRAVLVKWQVQKLTWEDEETMAVEGKRTCLDNAFKGFYWEEKRKLRQWLESKQFAFFL